MDGSYADVVVGLGYVSELETVKLDPLDREGSSTGKIARIDHVILRLYDSHGGEIGPDVDHLDPIPYLPEFNRTGDVKIAFGGPYQREKKFIVRHSDPTAFNLLSANVMLKAGER